MLIAAGGGALALPLLGVFAAGLPLERFLEFPPHTVYVRPSEFSWPAFAFLGTFIALTLPIYFRGFSGVVVSPAAGLSGCVSARTIGSATLLGISWTIAWTRFPALTWLQHHTFALVWCAYIFFVHRLLECRGASPFTGRADDTARLFAASAVFWWFFEWLNRFVQNWTYHNVDHFSPAEYWLFATMSFTSVLPAALATKSLLKTVLRFESNSEKLARHPIHLFNCFAFPATAVASVTLVLLPIYPNAFFPFLWLSPLLVLALIARRTGAETFLDLRSEEDFADFAAWSLAGLFCGILWEMWNFYSLAGWDYAIPFVGRFHVFAMPLLGYAGYLPFGVLCGLVCELLLGRDGRP